MKLKGAMSIMMVLLLGLLSLGNVSAGISQDYTIDRVEVDNRDISESDVNFITVERGDSLDVEVWVRGLSVGAVRDDIRVKAWIGGYEYGDIAEQTKIFKVEPSGLYKKTLSVSLPDDIDADNKGRSERYSLHVEVFDGVNEARKNYALMVEEKRHDLRIQDIIFRPGTVVNSGDMLFTTVRVENMGDKKEEDIQVKVSIPELGFLARDYIDELVPDDNDNEEEKSGDVELFGRIPKDVQSGDYDVKVELIFNRGHDVVSEDFTIRVEGKEKAGVGAEDSLVSVDATRKDVKVGESVSYKVMIANFGDEAARYSAEVLGVGAWGSAGVDPAFVAVNAGDTGELFVKVTPSVVGEQSFTVKVKSNGQVVKEVNLQANVAKSAADLRKGLEVGFAVLAILLVILGLIIAFTKLRSEGGDDEGPELEEEKEAGQTYY
ncbi:hypothetical protein J4443_02110 [Candidatus Woesearchaeota archaeon]|nr:hypothetical protein [Candidatus Woesearchaeota archaeon]